MTITQTVDIPANRRLTIDVPKEVTADKARVIVQFPVQKAVPKKGSKTLGMTMKELDDFLKNAHTPHSDALVGILSGMGDIDLDEMRMERLSRHLK